jgi:enoyl-CoA hydratase/carnithine racemase
MADEEKVLPQAGLRWVVRGAVATITLSRPERRNAMTPSMWHGLADIGEEIAKDDAIRVVIVRGADPSFCAGIDLRMFSQEGVPGEDRGPGVNDPGFGDHIAGYQAGYLWLRSPQFVSIAAVQGHAIGAGFQLALACDVRVVADNAKFCMREPALGLVPDLTGTKPLVELAGLPRAIELCLTAATIDAGQAREFGLAQHVVPAAGLDEKVAALTEALLSTDVNAARATKELLQQAPGHSLPEQAAAERAKQAGLLRARAQDQDLVDAARSPDVRP